MKTIIKLVVVVLVITTCFNASRAFLNNYQFEDAVHERLLFDPRATDKEIVAMVEKLAQEYDVPVDPDSINIRQSGQDILVDMSYTQDVVLVPGVFTRAWTFNPSTSTRMLVGNRRQP